MKRYCCISDVHGQYKKMIAALDKARFDKEHDTLVVLGDSFDRGHWNREVLDFILDCPHRILIWGNHDRRLMEIAMGDPIDKYDKHNGTTISVIDFAHDYVDEENRGNLYVCANALEKNPKLWQYFRECHFAVEFPDMIMTHAWLPLWTLVGRQAPELFDDWRETDRQNWSYATWANTYGLLDSPYNVFPDKTIMVGHWWAWSIAEKYGAKRTCYTGTKDPQIDCSTFIYENKAIFIDGCSNYENGGCVNVYVYESDAVPTFIK